MIVPAYRSAHAGDNPPWPPRHPGRESVESYGRVNAISSPIGPPPNPPGKKLPPPT
jgi:hypothetical protein